MTGGAVSPDAPQHHGSVEIDNTAPPHKAPHDIFFAAVKTTRMPMIVTDPHQADNPIIFCNDAFTFMTGYTEEEIVGHNCRFLQGPETDRAVIAQIRAAVEKVEEVAVEVLNYRKNGSTFWNALFVSPVYDAKGDLLYFFGSQLDISRRREAEEALHEAQKMEAVGKLTGGIAHDFNNLLQVIQGYTDILDARIDAGDRAAKRAVDAISAAAQRGSTLTQQLLAFARKQELRDRLMNFNSLIADFRPVIERTAGEGVKIRRDLEDNLWNCRIDPVQAEVALLNILSNARDAMEGAGEVTITTRNVVLPDGSPSAQRLDPGEYVLLTVADTGPGVDAKVADKIFDPFFTTKEMGKGTGLGLSQVYGFMKQSGGLAAVQNRAPGGAEFLLYFPRSSGGLERKPTAIQFGPQSGVERVLMVEDQQEVGELGRAVLEDLGYEVVLVNSARAALDVLKGDANFQLLFTDILMPGMNGVALAQVVRRDYAHTQVLLTTGFADDAIDEGAKSYELIRKPYRRTELNERIRAVLDKPGART
ncbi:hybrid sensor histidine kinase/response regulator [Sphingomonas lenta]|uniref:histidine kinase n=1 Tax=Sphingomonas lenta TaxID=1141887 RepID=A0A2A2SIK6_9SPHN|nr:hybrid sensor histidine kinase/response regulator [Sphingomonas lenta]